MTIETADDLADPKNAAAAFLKLQEDVKQMILDTVLDEITRNPWGLLATHIRQIALEAVRLNAREIIDREVQNYRIVYRGTTSSTY